MSRGTGAGRRWLTLSLAGLGILATAMLAIADPIDPATDSLVELVSDLAFASSLLAFILSGSVILIRRPDNSIGWLLLLPGVVMPASEVTARWLTSVGPPTELTPALWLILWVSGWAWVVLAFGIFHLLLTFPSGRLLTPRWRSAVALEAALIGAVIVLGAVTDPIGPMVDGVMTWSVDNPAGLTTDLMATGFGPVWGIGLVTITVLSAIALVLRFRRGTRDEREQLKWPLAAALLFGVVYALNVVASGSGGGSVVDALLGFALAAIPVSVAIAVLRYRLYEIDRIVSRTIAWTLTTAVVVGLFGFLVLAISTALGGATRNTVAVAVATLAAAALFQPIRRRLQAGVDRRFNRARVDAARTADAFAERLRDEVTIDVVTAELRTTVARALQPTSESLWLRDATTRAAVRGS